MNLNQLITYIQRSKLSNRPVDVKHPIKLTVAEQQAIQIGGTQELIVINTEDAYNLIHDSQVIPGAPYLITDTNQGLYGGTDILVYGISSKKLSTKGYGLFYNPNYGDFNMWDPNGSYIAGDRVTYGGSVWQNAAGYNETNNGDNFSLNTESWNIVSTYDSAYSAVWDEIEYNYEMDSIVMRYESITNNRVSSSLDYLLWWFCGNNPIKVFKWGHYYNGNNGISGCSINDSYLNCLNIGHNCSITAVVMEAGSMFSFLGMTNSSYMYDMYLTQGSALFGMTLDGSYCSGFKLDNQCYMSNIALVNSNFQYLEVRNNSNMQNINLTNSNLEFLEVINEASFNGVNLTNSTIRNLSIDNNAYFGNITLTNNCGIYQINMSKSSLNNFTMDSSNLWNWTIDNSSVQSLNCVGYFSSNLRFFGSQAHFNNVLRSGNGESTSIYEHNTIKYQFSINIGSLTDADIPTFPQCIFPAGWFLHSFIISGNGMSFDAGATIDLGITGNTTLILSAFDLSLINNVIFVSPIGVTQPVAIGSDQNFTGHINGTTHYGSFDIEIVLKNIGFAYDND